jgi:hypothetical protein
MKRIFYSWLLIVIIILVAAAVSSLVTLHAYKAHCELVGNAQGQRWLEC